MKITEATYTPPSDDDGSSTYTSIKCTIENNSTSEVISMNGHFSNQFLYNKNTFFLYNLHLNEIRKATFLTQSSSIQLNSPYSSYEPYFQYMVFFNQPNIMGKIVEQII